MSAGSRPGSLGCFAALVQGVGQRQAGRAVVHGGQNYHRKGRGQGTSWQARPGRARQSRAGQGRAGQGAKLCVCVCVCVSRHACTDTYMLNMWRC